MPQAKVPILRSDGVRSMARLKAVERYERRGLCRRRADGVYVFLGENDDARCAAVAAPSRRLNYGIGFASPEGVKNTPIVMGIKVFTGKRPAVPPADYGDPIQIAHRYLPLAECSY